ncbi:sodium:solute symporter family protein [Estrella lausannensis]|uniref:Sodium/solute symporter n=1 Tax=Estrella lausannensis TaxID=483423 RepID=A0A0H5DPQ7_9BACT|nr:sodium:solute symporter family protein [Estrella lausannensis]CRX38561.1 Sodium/solute symporter [Estrella lausannensis]
MDTTFFLILLFTLQVLYWIVGRFSSKAPKGKEEYFLANRKVSLFPLAMTFLATQVGGGVVLGAAEEAYQYGWPVLFYPLGSSLGLVLLGVGFGRRLATLNVSTVAEVFEKVYGSSVQRKAASLLSIVSLFMVLVAQIIASSKFMVSLGVKSVPLFILFWGIVILYTARGGLKAVISTDLVQAAFFSLVFALLFGWTLSSGGTQGLLTAGEFLDFSLASKATGWLLMPLMFMLIEQDMGQRCFAGKSPEVVSCASLLAGAGTMAVCTVPVLLGVLARIKGVESTPGGSILMSVIEMTTTPYIAAFAGCAILAAIISTATSLLNAIASNIGSDFSLDLSKGDDGMKRAGWLTALISLIAIYFAFAFNNIVDVLIQSYELSVSCLFVPVVFALFQLGSARQASLLAICFGAAGFVLFRFYPVEFPREIMSVILSLFGFFLGWAYARLKTKENYVIDS